MNHDLVCEKLCEITGLVVSRETVADLFQLIDELKRWQNIKNLVGPETLQNVWERHIFDSAQLVKQHKQGVWVDIGSGAGFPGLVIAILLKSYPHTHVHLVESNARKCAFLYHVARLLQLHVSVHQERIEKVAHLFAEQANFVTARALAPLDLLLEWSEAILQKGALGVFLKGCDVENELTNAHKSWTFNLHIVPSVVESGGSVLHIENLKRS